MSKVTDTFSIMLLCCKIRCRSGQYVYKPTMNRTCCPQYPIRCEVANLQLTKSQKKVIKRVNRYLSYGQCQSTSSEPERHGYEELPAAAAAAAGCQLIDNMKLQETLTSACKDTSATVAGPSGLQSTQTVSSTACKSKRKTPKPGLYFLSVL